MGKGPRHRKPSESEEEEASDDAGSDAGEGDESELEVGDIEAFARDNLRQGEMILGNKSEQEDVGLKEKEKRGILNKPMILRKLQDIEYKIPEGAKRIPWIDTLAIESEQELPKGVTSKDGTKLENAFMSMASDASKEAYRRLRVMKVPCSRPSDFYAEMFRPDSMMFKVRQWASEETRRIGIVENRKSQLAAKRFEKTAKNKKLQARASEKRDTLDEIQSWRKKTKRDSQNENEADLEDILNKHGLDKHGGKKKVEMGSKRAAKDAKYGHGGKKSGKKRNDAKSSRDFGSLAAKGKSKGKGEGGGKGKGKGEGKGKGKSKGGGGGSKFFDSKRGGSKSFGDSKGGGKKQRKD